MYVPLGIKSDYSLLKSLIKIPDLINYLKENNITTCALLDDNLFGSINFYDICLKNDIKPIIGLDVLIANYHIYLYAKNYEGYQNLLKINTLMQTDEVSYVSLKSYAKDVIGVLPYQAKDIYEEVVGIYDDFYFGYKDEYELKNVLLFNEKVVYVNEVCSFVFSDVKYLEILRGIETGKKGEIDSLTDSYLAKEVSESDASTTEELAASIDLVIPKNNKYIPHYDDKITDSYAFLVSLCKKGLSKRLDGQVKPEYMDRLLMELSVIKKMGFTDYFLIVYDYVKYAKTHGILVGPGRGSAAGSLVSYAIGITNVDPLKYDLLFERFLNPERVTMPDIDIDFEYNKRDQVISYVKERYGIKRVANIMTFGTLGARQVIRDVGKYLEIAGDLIDKLSNLLNPKVSLKENYENKYVKDFVDSNQSIKRLYHICFKLEGLKRHISTHAAGVVISAVDLDDVIPICKSGNDILTGVTMEYLEELGLLKMDFLALRNLTIIQNVLDLIKNETGENINLNEIDFNDTETLALFRRVDTEGIFQFESSGMKNFLAKLQVASFDDLVAALALFRPGPMENIDVYIRRKEGKEKVVYPDPSLEEILAPTYGIMIYQEQIMQVLVKMGGYSFAAADNIRRAMSKKKVEVMEQEREVFVAASLKNGYSKETAEEVYDLIIKFANYGFNKAHSVSYAIIGYQMAYLKSKYPVYFMANLLNMSIGSDIKTKEYIDEAKKKNIMVFKPNINISTEQYIIKDKALLLPLNTIHNVGESSVELIIWERKQNGRYTDFFNFVARTYGKSVNRKTIESLIDADAFRDFKFNHNSLFKMIDSALDYAVLCSDLDESLVMKPNIILQSEYTEGELMARELACFGFYVTNHPSSKYQSGIMKINKMKENFDKYVDLVVIVGSIRKIKTKKGEDMGFISGSDETGTCDFIIFPKNDKYLINLAKDDLIKVRGQVTKRIDKYQIVVRSIEKL